jgi:hypothetical protein
MVVLTIIEQIYSVLGIGKSIAQRIIDARKITTLPLESRAYITLKVMMMANISKVTLSHKTDNLTAMFSCYSTPKKDIALSVTYL